MREETIISMKTRQRKGSRLKEHRVYCTYFPDGRYYIGYSCKPKKQYDNYYGSSRLVREHAGELVKETIRVYSNRNEAKMQEMMLQLQCKDDDRCLNDMIHIRLRMSHLKDFVPERWEPRDYKSVQSDSMERTNGWHAKGHS